MMSFASPLMLLWLVPLGLLYLLKDLEAQAFRGLFAPEVYEKLGGVEERGVLARWRRPLLFLALSWMVVALARPVLLAAPETVKVQGIDMVVALDLSHSMSATDIAPSRAGYAKARLLELIELNADGRTAILGFSGTAFIVSPMVADRETLIYLAESLNPEQIVTKGTSLAALMRLVPKVSRNSPGVLVILSDGGDEESYADQAEAAKKAGITVYGIGIATPQGSALLDENNQTLLDIDKSVVVTALNPALEELCLQTGGEYVVAGSGDAGRIMEAIRAKFGPHALYEAQQAGTRELFYYPLMLAFGLFVLARFRMPDLPWRAVPLVVILLLPIPGRAGLFDFYILSEATRAYSSGDYAGAARAYERLATQRSEAALLYNLGASYYKMGAYQRAIGVWGRIRTADAAMMARVQAAMGNALALRGEYRRAVLCYRESLKIRPDAAVAHNLQIVMGRQESFKSAVEMTRRSNETQSVAANKGDQAGSSGSSGASASASSTSGGYGGEGGSGGSEKARVLQQSRHAKPLSGRQLYMLGVQGAGTEKRPW